MYRNTVIDIHRYKANNVIHMTQCSNCRKIEKMETHSNRVGRLCEALGIAMQLSEFEIRKLITSGLLHDIGKNSIDKRIINKPGPLSKLEWDQIKTHPTIGYRLLCSSQNMKEIAEYVLYHHERYDGMGYPMGLKGEEIPLYSRIISVADAYDAMINERFYQKALSKDEAVKELIINKGTQFDPDIVDIFTEKVLVCI